METKDKIDEATEDVVKMAANLEEMKKSLEAKDTKMEEILKEMANLNKSMIRSNEEEEEVGKNYGFLQAKKEVAMGKTAKVPYWDDKTQKRYNEYLHLIARKDIVGLKKAFGDNIQDGISNWTPTEFSSEVVRLSFVDSFMLPKVTIVPMGRDKTDLPMPSGDLAWGFASAGGAMEEDKFTAGALSLDTAKAYGMSVVNQEDLDDPAYPVAPYVAAQLAEDNAKFLDKVILYGDANGSGAAWEGEFDGWSDATSVNAVAGATDATQTWAELFTEARLIEMISSLDEQELEGAEFYLSPQGWAAIRALKNTNSDYLIPLNAAWNYPLFGFPTNITSRVITAPADSTAAGFFGNAKYIYFGDRMDMSIATSEHYRFANDQIVFRAIQRFAVAVGIPTALVKISFGAGS